MRLLSLTHLTKRTSFMDGCPLSPKASPFLCNASGSFSSFGWPLILYPFLFISNASGLSHLSPPFSESSAYTCVKLCTELVNNGKKNSLACREMDKETIHDTPSLLSNHNTTIKEDSPRKHLAGGAAANVGLGVGGDRLKRDEWSEGAVSTLLEAYETKWKLRNRAKLKGHDWEDVARYVSSRANSTKSSKTQTQCKNKIESMKKRYRSESATADASSWPLYPRLDLLLRGSSTAPPPPQSQQQQSSLPPSNSPHLMLLESSPMMTTIPVATIQVPVATIPVTGTAQNSHGSNGVDKRAKNEGVLDAKSSDHVSEQNAIDTDSSTPALLHSDNERLGSKKMKMKVDQKKKKRRREELEISDSIRWLAEVVVRSEQARMETMRELEKMRIEAEAKRGEMDLKRTEIIANTQLEIAKLFATAGKGVDSSLRIGRS